TKASCGPSLGRQPARRTPRQPTQARARQSSPGTMTGGGPVLGDGALPPATFPAPPVASPLEDDAVVGVAAIEVVAPPGAVVAPPGGVGVTPGAVLARPTPLWTTRQSRRPRSSSSSSGSPRGRARSDGGRRSRRRRRPRGRRQRRPRWLLG